jgi:hypothetical protein
MKTLRQGLLFLERRLNIWFILSFVVIANVWWTIVLQAFNRQFLAVTGFALPDLQNGSFGPRLTLETFQTQLASYNDAAKQLYWSFFILDNIVPVVAFGPFALIWIYVLRKNPNRLFNVLLASPFVLIPLGIGLFDWWENLFYVSAIQNGLAPTTPRLIQAGFAFGFIKGILVQATFFLTPPLLVYHLVAQLLHWTRRKSAKPAELK